MLVEVVSDNNSLVMSVPDDVAKSVPFESELVRWKEEIYFSTPYETRLDDLKACTHSTPGKVYYWPPEKAFCVFYGFSEPYTEVYLLGDYIGPLTLARRINVGRVRVVEHSLGEELADVINTTGKLGYLTATPMDGGCRVVVASKFVGQARVAFTIVKESFGFYVESDSFYSFSNSYEGVRITSRLKNRVKSISNTVRFDLNEDGYTCLTAVAKDLKSLESAVKELESVYQYIFKELTHTV